MLSHKLLILALLGLVARRSVAPDPFGFLNEGFRAISSAGSTIMGTFDRVTGPAKQGYKPLGNAVDESGRVISSGFKPGFEAEHFASPSRPSKLPSERTISNGFKPGFEVRPRTPPSSPQNLRLGKPAINKLIQLTNLPESEARLVQFENLLFQPGQPHAFSLKNLVGSKPEPRYTPGQITSIISMYRMVKRPQGPKIPLQDQLTLLKQALVDQRGHILPDNTPAERFAEVAKDAEAIIEQEQAKIRAWRSVLNTRKMREELYNDEVNILEQMVQEREYQVGLVRGELLTLERYGQTPSIA